MSGLLKLCETFGSITVKDNKGNSQNYVWNAKEKRAVPIKTKQTTRRT